MFITVFISKTTDFSLQQKTRKDNFKIQGSDKLVERFNSNVTINNDGNYRGLMSLEPSYKFTHNNYTHTHTHILFNIVCVYNL